MKHALRSLPMRAIALFLGACAIALPTAAESAFVGEPDVYRFGGTYTREVAPTAQMCAILCHQDQRCMAWSHGTVLADDARACELKSALGRAEPRPGFTSGIDAMFRAPEPPRAAPVTATRRQSETTGLRLRFAGVWENYEPVSADLEVDELAGGANNTPPRSQRTAPTERDYRFSDAYEPRKMRLIIGERVERTPSTRQSPKDEDAVGISGSMPPGPAPRPAQGPALSAAPAPRPTNSAAPVPTSNGRPGISGPGLN